MLDENIFYERLDLQHEFLPFDCGDNDLNEYLYLNSKSYQKQLLAVTYYLQNNTDTIVFFSLLNDKITAMELTNSFWRKIKNLFPHSKHRKDYPAVKIGRLGVNKNYQHTGDNWGTLTLDFIKHWMISENKTGCRFIIVDAYQSAVPFYLKNGFLFMGPQEKARYESNKGDTIALYFDLMQLVSD